MGQQQLLLLVLGTVIVGIAIVVGINAFRENSVKSNFDSMTQDAIRIANDLQQWKLKPQMFGGSDDATKGDAADFSDATFAALGYTSAAGNQYTNMNGLYTLDPASGKVTGRSEVYNNTITIEVGGLRECHITMVEPMVRDGITVTPPPAPLCE